MPAKAVRKVEKDILVHVNLMVLETADPHLLAELCADPKIGSHLAALISPTAAAGSPQSSDAVREQMLKLGHLPRTVAF